MADIFTLDFNDIINDPEIDIVIELIGGTGIAKQVILDALNAGKNVVTANKAGRWQLRVKRSWRLRKKKGAELAFEASVGGGIPIIGPLKHSLIANEISAVMGIVNRHDRTTCSRAWAKTA